MAYKWTCRCCGKEYDGPILDIGFDAPLHWHNLSEADRKARGEIDSNLCRIDQDFFVRGCLEIPIIDYPDVFIWGVWTSVSKESFKRILDLWEEEDLKGEPPLFGWLCNNINIYPKTFPLATNLHLRAGGKRPFIELEPTDHPLAIEQREGITLRRVEEIIAASRIH